MLSRIFVVAVAASLALAANKRVTGVGHGENQDLVLNVTIYGDAESVKEVVGNDLGGHFVVASVKVEPKYGKEITIDRDLFVLRTDKNGEKSTPMAPSQIAGSGALIITQTQGPGGEGAVPTRGWSMGGPIGIGRSSSAGSEKDADAPKHKPTMQQGDKEDPLKKILDEKVLPEKKVDQPLSGLLYFPMEGQRLKDLELIFSKKEDRISIRFK